MYWDPEWEALAKEMSEAPQLPERLDEKKQQAVNGILMMAASRLPPAPDNVSSCTTLSEPELFFAEIFSLMVSVDDDRVPNGPNVRVYKPTSDPDGTYPLVYFIHGGGWFTGNLDTEDRTCRMVSGLADAVVVSVDYRCGFEVPLKDEVDDCVAGLHWAHEQATTLGADVKKVVVLGGSAGGSLAVATVHAVVKAGTAQLIAGLVGMNPLTLHPDATPRRYEHLMTSYSANAGPLPFVSGDDTMGLYEHWNVTPSTIDLDVFPAAGGPDTVKGFPPTFLISSDNDASRDDSTVLEAMLRDVRARVKRENFLGLAHYFWTFPLPKVNERFWKCLVDGVRWTLDGEE